MTNCCAFDCSYCVNRKSNDIPRATFTPRELAELTVEFYRRKMCIRDSSSSMNSSGNRMPRSRVTRYRKPVCKMCIRDRDSVLIFQSPAKGLRKNQQTQPVQAPAVRFRQGSQRVGMSTGMTADV